MASPEIPVLPAPDHFCPPSPATFLPDALILIALFATMITATQTVALIK